jgi:hypothetical protein
MAGVPGDLALPHRRVERCPQCGKDAELRRRSARARLAEHVAVDLYLLSLTRFDGHVEYVGY